MNPFARGFVLEDWVQRWLLHGEASRALGGAGTPKLGTYLTPVILNPSSFRVNSVKNLGFRAGDSGDKVHRSKTCPEELKERLRTCPERSRRNDI